MQVSFSFTRRNARILVVVSVIILCHTPTHATDTPAAGATPAPSPTPSSADSESSFLAQYVSVQIPGGIRGIAPGTPIAVMSELGDRLRVKADDLEFEVRKDQITHDRQMAM